MRRFAALALLFASACAPEVDSRMAAEPVTPVTGTSNLHLVRDPGPPPNDESPPLHTLYEGNGAAARPVGKFIAVSNGGRARVDAAGKLTLDGAFVDDHVRPELSVSADGTVAYVRAEQPPQTDVFRVRPSGKPERVTTDGRSERPFFLPDGTLLYTSSGPGRPPGRGDDPSLGKVGWFRDGKRLNAFPQARVPAFPARTRFEGGRVIFDAGDAWYTLDPSTGLTERLP